ncbi:hypothetical protein [Desulfoluna butyratoxydans]|uniref:Uncharacterized protein n=1 Tax=Desulfoluna butyratoxydans TaxID=231438 RepID=A0A4U8YXP1_9BACT|nr:hypothetical protein [Desulfoluna butyratoxydans]VFQ46233.1 hypothetical protein MSL71_38960 [Desulfoluna butyratoxydans]
MVFISTMLALLVASHFGRQGLIYGFILGISMEVVNLVVSARVVRKAEENTRTRYMGLLEKKKDREKLLEGKCESLTREIDTLDRQVKELEEKTNGYMHQVTENEKVIDKLRRENEKQARLIDAAGNRLP